MAQLPLDQAIDRFKDNEGRADRFINGSDTTDWRTSDGALVPSLRKFQKTVNAVGEGWLAKAEVAANIAQSRADIVLTAAFGAVGATLDTLTYSMDGVVAGATVRAGDTNALYEVMPSDAANPDFMGVGGVKYEIVIGIGGITPMMTGASGDGVTDDTVAVQLALNIVASRHASGTLFNNGLGANMTALRGGGKVYAVSSEIAPDSVYQGHNTGGAGGTYNIRDIHFIAIGESWGEEDAVLRLSSSNSEDWTESAAASRVRIDCNRKAYRGIWIKKSVGALVDSCHVTRYLDRGIGWDDLAYNVEVRSCYVGAFPYGTGEANEGRGLAPEYGIYCGNSDGKVFGNVVLGNIFGLRTAGKTRIIGNHLYGNKWSIEASTQFAVIIGNYLEDPVYSVGLPQISLIGNFYSESIKGACVYVVDDGSGNGRGSTISGGTRGQFNWTVAGGLTLSATEGTAVTVTSTAPDFLDYVLSGHTSHGAVLQAGNGRAIITNVIDQNTVTVQVITPFASTSIIAGGWDIQCSFIAVVGANTDLYGQTFYMQGDFGPNATATGQVLATIGADRMNLPRLTTMRVALPQGSIYTIASGAITIPNETCVIIDTEGTASDDDLDTITISGGAQDGHVVILRTASSVRDVRLTSAGNLILVGGECRLSNAAMFVTLKYNAGAATWNEIGRSAPASITGAFIGPTSGYIPVTSGAISVTKSRHAVSTASAPQTVTTINGGLYAGMLLTLSASSSANALTVNNTGNVRLSGGTSFVSLSANDRLVLEWNGSLWCEVTRSLNS